MKKSIFAFLVLAVVLCAVCVGPSSRIFAQDSVLPMETKSYCEATLDHDFADNRVLIVLNQSATMNFKTYAPIDFPEANCLQIEELSEYTAELVQQQLKIKNSGDLKLQDNKLSINNSVNIDDFRTVLTLELADNSKENVLETIKRLEQRNDVLFVEPDYRMTFFAAPSPTPTYYSEQWAVNYMQLTQAWDITIGKESVVVGVMDSGIDGSHPDLTDRIDRNSCGVFTTGSVTVTNPTDGEGHGTNVAGIIGAQRNSGTPFITGVGRNIRLASLQINDPDNEENPDAVGAFVSSAIRALQFAKQKGIPIVNLSAGYDAPRGTTTQRSALEQEIINYGGLFVCAAGNGTKGDKIGKNNDESAIYPSNFRLPNLISVGSTDYDTLSKFSNFGANTVDIFAPGVYILTTDYGLTGWTFKNGTSLAAPYVAGVAALIKSVNPNLTPAQIKAAIMNNVDKATDSGATKLPSIYGKCVSNGRVNAFKAVSSVAFQINAAGNAITGLNFTPSGELTIPEEINGKTITSIGASAFAGCSGLTSITIPNTVTSIGAEAFANCTGLTTVTFQAASNLTSIGTSAFWDCNKLANITIPSSVASIGESAFWKCGALTSVTIPNKVTSIEASTFAYCSKLATVTFESTSKVASIKESAFWGCSALTSITIPNSVTNFGPTVFAECTGLANVTFQATSKVSSIGESAFWGCSKLTSITIPNSVTSVGPSSFAYCTELTNVTFQATSKVTSIGESAFWGCTKLTNITMPSSVTSIGHGAFQGCSGLTSLTTPFVGVSPFPYIGYMFGSGSTGWVGQNAFVPDSLKTVTVTGSNVGNFAFYDCNNLTSVVMSGNVTSIGESAFYNCTSLINISIPSTVTTIGKGAFQNCTGLTSITIPSSVTSIGHGAFQGCSGLTSLTTPFVGVSPFPYIGYMFGSGSTGWVGQNAFVPDSLKTVTVTGSNVGNFAFYDCNNLTSVVMLGNVTSIGESAFYNCAGLTSITIPSSVTSIGANAFAGTGIWNNSSANGVVYADKWAVGLKGT